MASESQMLADYLASNHILIVDTVSTARVSLATNLARLGASRQKMSLVGSIQEAREEISKFKPKIIFTDYTIGDYYGFDLIQDQKQQYMAEQVKVTDCMFVLVTANASQSAVARSAEEDVDTFVIKPYTFDLLRFSLTQAVKTKLKPSRYLQLIEAGKDQLNKKEVEKALAIFAEAKGEHKEPTLACFYYGFAEFMKDSIHNAKASYNEGLSYNKLHYKCLIGLYELLHQEGKYKDAYEVIKKVAEYFPANSKRLGPVLRLAIMTENYEDIVNYYGIFKHIPERTEELVKYMCSALVVAGKYFLIHRKHSQGIECFDNAVVTAAGRAQFYLYIVENLVKQNLLPDGKRYLERLEKISPGSPEFRAGQFIISTLESDVGLSIHLGRSCIKEGVEFPSVYEKLIAQSVKAGYKDSAEELFQKAIEKWPNLRNSFEYALLMTPAEAVQLKTT